jgi:hypothetical protein
VPEVDEDLLPDLAALTVGADQLEVRPRPLLIVRLT